MIKGCAKRVVVVKDVESKLFEEAYFIVRPQGVRTEDEYLGEAARLLCEEGSAAPGTLPELPVSPAAVRESLPAFVQKMQPYGRKKQKKHTVPGGMLFGIGMLVGMLCSMVVYFTVFG